MVESVLKGSVVFVQENFNLFNGLHSNRSFLKFILVDNSFY